MSTLNIIPVAAHKFGVDASQMRKQGTISDSTRIHTISVPGKKQPIEIHVVGGQLIGVRCDGTCYQLSGFGFALQLLEMEKKDIKP